MPDLFSQKIDFRKPLDGAGKPVFEARKLSVDDVESGKYEGKHPVTIVDGFKGSGKNDTQFLGVTFESNQQKDRWSLKHCYFDIGQLAELCRPLDIEELKEGDLPDILTGKKLQIRVGIQQQSTDKKFVVVKEHYRL